MVHIDAYLWVLFGSVAPNKQTKRAYHRKPSLMNDYLMINPD